MHKETTIDRVTPNYSQQFRLNWVHNHLFNVGEYETHTERALKSNDFKSFLKDSSIVATLSQRQTDSETPTSNYPLPQFSTSINGFIEIVSRNSKLFYVEASKNQPKNS